MDRVLLESDASGRGCMPLKVLRQKNNVMPLILPEQEQDVGTEQENCCEKKGSSLDPYSS